MSGERPAALVTGVSRRIGIGAAIATTLAADGWDIAMTYWQPYDERMPWGSDADDLDVITESLHANGAASARFEADLSDATVPARVVADARDALGPITALVMCHCESVDGGIDETTIESFDLHMVVNARASWLLIKAFAEQFDGRPGTGRIVALTSDATVGNLAYGASKGALDRIVIAAADELAGLGITANVINPGATDTGWMDDGLKAAIAASTFGGRVGQAKDCANLVRFLCSADGGWMNGQLLMSDGGRRPV